MAKKRSSLLSIDAWDSRFFKVNIGRARFSGKRSGHGFSTELSRLLGEAKARRVNFLILKLIHSKRSLENRIRRSGFNDFGEAVDFRFKARNSKTVLKEMPFFVRACTPRDMNSVKGIARDAFRLSYLYRVGLGSIREVDRYHATWISNLFKDKESKVLVAARNNTVCGFIGVSFDKITRTARIMLVAVRKGYRGEGVGSMLIDEVLGQERKRSRALFVKTQSENVSAIALYKRRGFIAVGREKIFCKRIG